MPARAHASGCESEVGRARECVRVCVCFCGCVRGCVRWGLGVRAWKKLRLTHVCANKQCGCKHEFEFEHMFQSRRYAGLWGLKCEFARASVTVNLSAHSGVRVVIVCVRAWWRQSAHIAIATTDGKVCDNISLDV